MSDALNHIELAIVEVAKALSAVARGKSVQIRAADERDKMKAVAYAWFKSHRPQGGNIDITAVDQAYKTILDSTARLAARSTYVQALKEAKTALVSVRRNLTTSTTDSAPLGSGLMDAFQLDHPPGFSILTADVSMQEILNRRWEEVQQCINAGASLAATVMMGGLLETLLLARINVVVKKGPIFTAATSPKDKSGKTLPLHDWKLINMVEVACELGWITKSAKDISNVLRDFRNYIHPHKEHTDGVVISKDDVKIFWEVCKAISRQVLSSVGKMP